jgi:hypothetical protein
MMGWSVEETVGVLAAMAQQGSVGAEAGTALKSALLNLVSPSKTAAAAMAEYGSELDNGAGGFITVTELAGQLQRGLADLTETERIAALTDMGGAYGLKGLMILFQEGEEGIANWIRQVDDWGYAATAAAAKTDNLKGDIERLGGSLETVAINTGGSLNGIARGIVQMADDSINALNNVPPAILGVTTGIVGFAGVALTGLGAAGKLAGAINSLREAETIGGDAADLLGTKLRTLSKGFGFATAAAVSIQLLGKALDSIVEAGDNLPNYGQMMNSLQEYAIQLGFNTSGIDDFAGRMDMLDGLFTVQIDNWWGATNGMRDFFNEMRFAEGEAGSWGSIFTGIGNAISGMYSDSPLELMRDHLDNVNVSLVEFINRGYGSEVALIMDEMRAAATESGYSLAEFDQMMAPVIVKQEEMRLAAEALVPAVMAANNAFGQAEEVDILAERLAVFGDNADKAAGQFAAMGVSVDQQIALIERFGSASLEAFQTASSTLANAAASISNSSNAWDEARGKAEKPPNMAAWIKSMESQAKAFEDYQANMDVISERIRTELPADAQEAAEGMLLAYAGNKDAIAMLAQAGLDDFALLTDAYARTGEGAGKSWAQEFAAELLTGLAPAIEALTGIDVTPKVNTADGIASVGQLGNAIQEIDGTEVTVTIDGNTVPLDSVHANSVMSINTSKGTVTIFGNDGQALSTLRNYTTTVDTTKGTVTIAGNDSTGRQVVYTFKGHIDSTTGQIKVGADISGAQRTVSAWAASIPPVVIPASVQISSTGLASMSSAGIQVQRKAAGGAITGGTPGVDSVLGLLMPGEHVWTTREVDAVGGHAAMFDLRSMALAGQLPKFAEGGPVHYVPSSSGSDCRCSRQQTTGSGTNTFNIHAQQVDGRSIRRELDLMSLREGF